jgi:hypothetical protein
MALLYQSKLDKGKRPWELPRPKRLNTEGTVFHQRFLTITLDEMHTLRNLGIKYFAGLRLFHQGVVKLGLTGTPLLTSPRVRLSSSATDFAT